MRTTAAQPAPATLASADVLPQAEEAIAAAEQLLQSAKAAIRNHVADAGGLDGCQHAAHGLAWLATYVEAMRQLGSWGKRLSETGTFGELEQLLCIMGVAEYAAQI